MARKTKASGSASLTVKAHGGARGSEVEVSLDDNVLDQLEQAFGDDVKRVKLEIVDDDGALDSEAVKELGRSIEVADLVKLGELVDEHGDDLASAAVIAADGDIERALKLAEQGVEWVGGAHDDEEDYAQHVIDEGLMGDKLGDYFDYEKYGRDQTIGSNSVEIGGKLIVFHQR